MDYDSLKLFLHLAETLHFAKTSRACFVSPSGLSRAIQRLEKEVGQSLFVRDNRSVSITKAGLLLKEHARQTLERWQNFKENVAEDRGELYGEISIYCSVTASYSILQNILSSFRKLHPHVHIKLQTGDPARAIQMVQNGSVDISIAAKPDNLPGNLDFKTAAITRLIFIAPKGLCQITNQLKKDFDNWWDIPMILPEHGLARKRIHELFKINGKIPNIYAEVSGNEAIIAMVSLGCGIGVVPELVLSQSSLKTKVQMLDIKNKFKQYQVGFCLKKNALSYLIIRTFWDIIKNTRMD